MKETFFSLYLEFLTKEIIGAIFCSSANCHVLEKIGSLQRLFTKTDQKPCLGIEFVVACT